MAVQPCMKWIWIKKYIYIAIVMKESFAKDFANAWYYSVLSDGSADSAVTEQELVYVLYLSKDGVSIVKYLLIESDKNGDASGSENCIKSISKVWNYQFFRTIVWFKCWWC